MVAVQSFWRVTHPKSLFDRLLTDNLGRLLPQVQLEKLLKAHLSDEIKFARMSSHKVELVIKLPQIKGVIYLLKYSMTGESHTLRYF